MVHEYSKSFARWPHTLEHTVYSCFHKLSLFSEGERGFIFSVQFILVPVQVLEGIFPLRPWACFKSRAWSFKMPHTQRGHTPSVTLVKSGLGGKGGSRMRS